MGFDSIWIPDTMITREHALDWAPTLGAFVEHTQDIMLGTCVVVVPHRHPAILGEGGGDAGLPVRGPDHLWRRRRPDWHPRI